MVQSMLLLMGGVAVFLVVVTFVLWFLGWLIDSVRGIVQ